MASPWKINDKWDRGICKINFCMSPIDGLFNEMLFTIEIHIQIPLTGYVGLII